MNKITKIIITIAVFTLVILYFILAIAGSKTNTDTACMNLDNTLIKRAQEYFSNNLPKENGETKTASINELIMTELILLEDLEKVGTSCRGNVYVTASNGEYIYSNDVTCGICSTESLYTVWSDWIDSVPYTGGKRTQIQAMQYYNYGSSEAKYTKWSDWAKDTNTINNLDIPLGVEIIDTETEEKTQYSYRDGSFKWYKVGSKNYYNNGAFYEKQPQSGYEKDTNTKKVSRKVGPEASKNNLISSVTGYDYQVNSVKGYIVTTNKYKYYKDVETAKTCKTYKPYYTCYKINSIVVSKPDVGTSAQALSSCQAAAGNFTSSCNTMITTPANTSCDSCPTGYTDIGNNKCQGISGGTYKWKCNFRIIKSGVTWYCSVQCKKMPAIYNTCTKDTLKQCLTNYGKDKYYGSYRICTNESGGRVSVYWSTDDPPNFKLSSLDLNDDYFKLESSSNGDGTIEIINKSCASTPALYGYTFTNQVQQYTSGNYVVCPSGYPYATPTGTLSNECAVWNSPATTRYYLKANGSTTTSISEAAYLSGAQITALGSKANGYKAIGSANPVVSEWTKGNCPNILGSGVTCNSSTKYEAEIYSYKWYKTSASSKIWWNNEEYSSKSPGSEWTADTSSARWGEWSTFDDTKVTASSTREIKTQNLKRIRKSYIDPNTLELKEWLPLKEFESKVGKSVEELMKDTEIKVQTKIMYRYRTLK